MTPDLSALTLPELQALLLALWAARAAGLVVGEGFECALMADDEAVTVTFSVPVSTEVSTKESAE